MCQSLLENRWPISAILADESVTRVEHRRLDLKTTQRELLGSGVAIPGPTRALARASTYLALASKTAGQESRDNLLINGS